MCFRGHRTPSDGVSGSPHCRWEVLPGAFRAGWRDTGGAPTELAVSELIAGPVPWLGTSAHPSGFSCGVTTSAKPSLRSHTPSLLSSQPQSVPLGSLIATCPSPSLDCRPPRPGTLSVTFCNCRAQPSAQRKPSYLIST